MFSVLFCYRRIYPHIRLIFTVLGSRCPDITCGNSSHWSYYGDKMYYYGGHYDDYWQGSYFSYYNRFHDAYYCNMSGICSCAIGYKEDNYGLTCQQSKNLMSSLEFFRL